MIFIPSFFKKFACRASKCRDTCCKGWNISLDKISKEMLEVFNNKYPDLAPNSIEDKNGISYIKFHNGICPYLNANNLCEIQRLTGNKYLCYICREYPRNNKRIGKNMKYTLSLSCEEVVALILKQLNLEELIISDILDKDMMVQNKIIEQIIAVDVQQLIYMDKRIVMDCFTRMDISDVLVRQAITKPFCEKRKLTEDEIRKLTGYYIWSYFDGKNSYETKQLSLFMICLYDIALSDASYSFEDKVFLIHKISKEIEHCDKNLKIIKECIK